MNKHNSEINILTFTMALLADLYLLKIKSVAYSSQGSHTGQAHFCNWLADSSTTG